MHSTLYNYKVLIVDDIPHNVEILWTTLEEKYLLATASNGEEALALIPSFRPDLVLLDVMMPGMDGYEVCKRIKQNDQYNFVKVILVTGKALVEERLKGYDVGADDYVTKPFVIKELEAKINVFLNLKHSKEIDKLKTDLLSLFSHEARTPLNGIIGGSELLLLDTSLEESKRNIVKLIHNSGNRLYEFVEKTLFLCELKGRTQLIKESSSASGQFRDIIHSLKERANEKKVRLQVDLRDDIIFEADWGMLGRVFSYLIENAIKFSGENGSVWINQTLCDNKVVFNIRDEGTGIQPDWLEKIFDEFAIKDINHHKKGQGLSLAISKHIAELHGGLIEVQSEENKGATFTLSIPYEPHKLQS